MKQRRSSNLEKRVELLSVKSSPFKSLKAPGRRIRFPREVWDEIFSLLHLGVPKSVLLAATGVSPETFNLRLRNSTPPAVKLLEVVPNPISQPHPGPCEVELGNGILIRVPLECFSEPILKLLRAC
jgi:hypothetical protein